MHRRIVVSLILFLFLLLSIVGCGASANMKTADSQIGTENYGAVKASNSVQYAEEAKGDGGQNANVSNSTSIVNTSQNSGHKVIQTGEISLETLKFDETVSKLNNYIASVGGYIESSSIQGNNNAAYGTRSRRTANFVFRVPQGKYSQLFIDVKGFGSVVSEQSRGEDITDKYFDTEAHLKTLKIQEERLLDLLKKADKMQDILAIEKELENVRYQIESLTGTIKKWDSLVNLSTVTINVTEVEEIQPVSPSSKDGLFSRIAIGFKNSVRALWKFTQDLIVFIIVALPFLIPIAVICLIVFHIWKRKKADINKNINHSGE